MPTVPGIIDISWPIGEGMTTYKNSKIVRFEHNKCFENDAVRESTITINAHTGTHIDVPAHFLEQGTTTEQICLERCIGTCRVLDLSHVDGAISDQHLLDHDIRAGQRILLKTKNSQRQPQEAFDPDFVYLDKSGAQFLVDKGVMLVGIDYLGIERQQPNHETHALLLGADIVVIEGLRLLDVEAGLYTFCCLPLALQGLEAAPARAVLYNYGTFMSK